MQASGISAQSLLGGGVIAAAWAGPESIAITLQTDGVAVYDTKSQVRENLRIDGCGMQIAISPHQPACMHRVCQAPFTQALLCH
jgi:hypothetical protein